MKKKTVFSVLLRTKKTTLFIVTWAVCIVGIGIAVLYWRAVRRPFVCHASTGPECVVMPVKQRMQYGIYDEIVSHEKKNHTVHLLPPDHVPDVDEAKDKSASGRADGGGPHSTSDTGRPSLPQTAPGGPLQDVHRAGGSGHGTKAGAMAQKKAHQATGISPSFLTVRIRIGNGFVDESKAHHSLAVLVRDGLVPKSWRSKVMLRAMDDLRFAVFLWGDMTPSDWAQYQNTLRKNNVPYTVFHHATKGPVARHTAS